MPRLCVDVSCGLCIVAGCFAGMWGAKVGDICLFGFLYLVCAVVLVMLWFGCVGCGVPYRDDWCE